MGILSGKKTWEIRGTTTKVRQVVRLAQSGSGMLVGEARAMDCLRLDPASLHLHAEKHCIKDLSIVTYRKVFAWVLQDATRYDQPKPYKHPQGVIMWVRLDAPRGVSQKLP